LIVLWEASDRACGKRLKSLLPALLPALEHHRYLALEPAIRSALFSVSAATIDRLLREVRSRKQAGRGMRAPPVLGRVTHPRMDGPWRDPQPGFLHMHMTYAERRGAAGHRVRTLTVTDLCSGWTQRATVPDWQPGTVVQCLDTLLGSLPFTPRGLALDEKLTAERAWLTRPGTDYPMEVLSVSRPKPPRRDHAGHDPRRSRLLVVTSVYANVFRGLFERAPVTPCARLLASGALSETQRMRLRAHAQSLDPFGLLAEIRALNSQLRSPSSGKRRSVPQPLPAGVPNRRRPRPRRPAPPRSWRTHPNVFERAWPAIQEWLLAEPQQTGMNLLERLKRKFPGVYRDGHLRSVQRRLKQWRRRAGVPAAAAHPDSAGRGDPAPPAPPTNQG
jgi:hypothetical protein